MLISRRVHYILQRDSTNIDHQSWQNPWGFWKISGLGTMNHGPQCLGYLDHLQQLPEFAASNKYTYVFFSKKHVCWVPPILGNTHIYIFCMSNLLPMFFFGFEVLNPDGRMVSGDWIWISAGSQNLVTQSFSRFHWLDVEKQTWKYQEVSASDVSCGQGESNMLFVLSWDMMYYIYICIL